MSCKVLDIRINASLVEVVFKRHKKKFIDVIGTVEKHNGIYHCRCVNGKEKEVKSKKKVKKFFKKQAKKSLDNRYNGYK